MAVRLQTLTPNVMVEDVNSTIQYYQDVLGFKIQATVPEEGLLNWAMLQHDDVVIMFQSRQSLGGDLPIFKDKAIDASLTFFIKIKGIDELYANLNDRAKIVEGIFSTSYGTREFIVEDCNGYILSFAEEV